jgi:hypothetical protein
MLGSRNHPDKDMDTDIDQADIQRIWYLYYRQSIDHFFADYAHISGRIFLIKLAQLVGPSTKVNH